jgi:hypothetical protein
VHTNVTASGVAATAVANTADNAAATGYAAVAVADTADNMATAGTAAAKVAGTANDVAIADNVATKVADTADDAAATGNAATKVTDTADIAATADVAATTTFVATADDAVTSAITIVAIPAVTTANANAAGNANMVNSVQVRKRGTTKIGKVIYPNATTVASGNTGITTGENEINSIHIADSISVDGAVDALISISIHMCDSSIISVQLSLLD